MFNPFSRPEQSQNLQEPQQEQQSSEPAEEQVEEVSQRKILSKITHPNRKVIAADILAGEMSVEELNRAHGYYAVEEMRRQIEKAQGIKRECKTCKVK